MTESKFTKGPWRYGDGGIFAPWDDEKDCNPLIAHVENAGMNGPQTAEGRANGHLIASAWELYEALKAAEEHLDYCGYGDSYEREVAEDRGLSSMITAALIKAEGRS